MPSSNRLRASLLDGLRPAASRKGGRKGAREGAGRTARQRKLQPDPRRHPTIARVCGHLACEVIEFRGAGEPSCFFLGAGFSLLRATNGVRCSPSFRTVDALEYFCVRHLDAYLAIEALPASPAAWFWNRE